MEISVIIPTYKPKEYLYECLDSIVNQEFPKEKFEVILVLNGCGHPYKEEIEKYISVRMAGMNVNFIHTMQGGVSNARNLALNTVRGKYVAFIDDDDFISSKYLDELYSKVTEDTIALSYGYAFKDGELSKQLMNYSVTVQFEQISRNGKQLYTKARKFFSGPCMKLIPMSMIMERRFDSQFKNGEDSLFMFLISDKMKYVDFTSRDAVYYRRYRNNSAMTGYRSRGQVIKNALKLITCYLEIYFKSPKKYNFIFLANRILGAVRSCF